MGGRVGSRHVLGRMSIEPSAVGTMVIHGEGGGVNPCRYSTLPPICAPKLKKPHNTDQKHTTLDTLAQARYAYTHATPSPLNVSDKPLGSPAPKLRSPTTLRSA